MKKSRALLVGVAVHNVAERGAVGDAQAIRFEREVADRDRSVPGVALVYVGHNEPFIDPGAVIAPSVPWLDRVRPFLAPSWLVRDGLAYVRSLRAFRPPTGMQRYELALRQIVERAQDSGLTPVLFTLPSNISGIEPNAYAKETPGIAELLRQGVALERSGDYERAIEFYDRHEQALLNGTPSAALQLRYRIAHCEQALGKYEQARQSFWQVVDRDPRLNFGRATRAQNALVRRLADEYGVPLVDGVAAFERASPHGILDNALFSDGHHPNLEGYRLLAAACAERLVEVAGGERTSTLITIEELTSRTQLRAAALHQAHVAAGSWLLTTAVDHPWPMDRMALAETHFRAAVGSGNDVSAWLGVAIAQAAARGDFLQSPDVLGFMARSRMYYAKVLAIPDTDHAYAVQLFRRAMVDAAVVDQLEQLWR